MTTSLIAKFVITAIMSGHGAEAAAELGCKYPKPGIVDCSGQGDATYSEFDGSGIYAQVWAPKASKRGKVSQRMKFYIFAKNGALVEVKKPHNFDLE